MTAHRACRAEDAAADPAPDRLHMNVPSRTKVTSSQVAVSGRVLLFTTVGACFHHKLVADAREEPALAAAELRWRRDVGRFLAEVRELGLLTSAADAALSTWPGPVIGWSPKLGRQDGPTRAICTDLGWTIAVLSRVVGPLLLPRRAPRLTWEQLFLSVFALDDTLVKMDFELPWDDNRLAVRRMVAQAHARGMRVMIIPHLWVEAGGWRGEVEPGTPERWAEYQESYRAFVLHWARDAALAGADAFSIGVECKSWSGRFPEVWRALIADVRAVFGGLLTYSANWDEAVDVLFWDQLDLVGINAFYPLADHSAATTEEYIAGAERIVPSVAELATTLEMPILFVEVGYTTRPDAAVEPWLWPDDMTEVVVDEAEQARALDAILRAFIPHEWFAGFFVWRYYADPDDVSQEAEWGFSPRGKLAELVLRDAFMARWAADGPWLPGEAIGRHRARTPGILGWELQPQDL